MRAPIVTALFASVLASAVWAQTPDVVHFTLAAKDGKTTFRMGEAIEVELRFTSSMPGEYAAWTLWPSRFTRVGDYDTFTAEPSDGVVDPLADSFEQRAGHGIAGRMPVPAALMAAPVRVGLQVNGWLSFRKPGHYRIRAESTRTVTAKMPRTALTLRSNELEIEIVAPEPGWAEAELRKALATLAVQDPPRPQIGQWVDLRAEQVRRDGVEAAARTLRYLDTPEAARAMARLYRHGTQYAETELRAGLIASPYRKEAIAAMEAEIASPDVAIDSNYLGELVQLVKLARFGPIAAYSATTREEIARWMDEVQKPYDEKTKGVDAEYSSKLAAAVALKQGQAKAVSLETLASRPAPPSAEISTALLANFRLLPEDSQARFLGLEWYRIASAAAAGLAQSIAESDGDLRDLALARLQELNPDAARQIILDRIRKLDIGGRGPHADPRVLLTLPDQTLPELDDVFASAAERNSATILVARYASAAIAGPLKARVDQTPGAICSSPMLAVYLFRVDADWAEAAIAHARQLNPRVNCLPNVSPNEDLLMSPGLEKQAIAGLAGANSAAVRQAQALLQYGASAAAEKPLLAALKHWQETSSNPAEGGVEYGFVAALLNASRWVPSEETIAKVLELCRTDQCKKQVSAAQREREQPLGISLDVPVGFGGLMVGSTLLRSDEQLRERLQSYPQGTQFYLRGNGPGSWYYEQRSGVVRRIVEDAGMKVADSPAPVR